MRRVSLKPARDPCSTVRAILGRSEIQIKYIKIFHFISQIFILMFLIYALIKCLFQQHIHKKILNTNIFNHLGAVKRFRALLVLAKNTVKHHSLA